MKINLRIPDTRGDEVAAYAIRCAYGFAREFEDRESRSPVVYAAHDFVVVVWWTKARTISVDVHVDPNPNPGQTT